MQIPSKSVHVRMMGYPALMFLIEQIEGRDFLESFEIATRHKVVSDAKFKIYTKSRNLIERMFTETDCTIQKSDTLIRGNDYGNYTVQFWDKQGNQNRFAMYGGACYFQAVAVAYIIGKTGEEMHEVPVKLHP